ncbi:MAG: pyruvate kinase [Lachnospiraceae bacterium]|uniref:pyruvate kinase n=1 Tax=Roseburia hominis TaxID=301301 RepID=UPI001F022284|nr:pyruvate kinase [Roseburia hominis]MDD6170536.1 pyruvate kinase [Lachnospiraceae bacterium]MDY4839242.1 pyruvate kinase [Lachnospiraceae bacterium]
MRKTKIICTMGPSTEKGDTLKQLVLAGMNVARMNFSHGDFEEHGGRLAKLKEIRKETGRPVAALLDTKGPEIRLGDFETGKIELQKGQDFTLTARDIMGNQNEVSITYKQLPKDVKAGSSILLDDGLIGLEVKEVAGDDIHCVVLNGGPVSNHKGVNVPGTDLSMEYLSEKDKADIIWGAQNDVDFIAASFVREAADVKAIRELLKANGGENIQIIAKIENEQGVRNVDEILEAADGVMVARGDMGVEIPCEEVPVIQKMIIKKANQAGKIVVTATQMLDSMIKNPRPTRAEATDVANAIYDGTVAIMLSGETAAGQYPVEALKTMVKIAERTEEDINYRRRFFETERKANPDVTDAICHATCTTALDLKAKAIVSVTKSGRSAKMVSRYKPGCDIIACSTDEKVCRQLNVVWGVKPILLEEQKETFDLFDSAVAAAAKEENLEKGDTVVLTSGVPIGVSGTTNMIKVQTV